MTNHFFYHIKEAFNERSNKRVKGNKTGWCDITKTFPIFYFSVNVDAFIPTINLMDQMYVEYVVAIRGEPISGDQKLDRERLL